MGAFYLCSLQCSFSEPLEGEEEEEEEVDKVVKGGGPWNVGGIDLARHV